MPNSADDGMSQRQIPGYPDYFATDAGQILSVRRGKQILMRPDKTRLGYLRVGVSNDGGRTRVLVHRLVAMAWLVKPDWATEINHIDSDKENNRPENLEWSTRSKNVKHAFDCGAMKAKRGAENAAAKLTEADVIEIKLALQNHYSGMERDLGEKYGVTSVAIGHIKKGKNWAHVKI